MHKPTVQRRSQVCPQADASISGRSRCEPNLRRSRELRHSGAGKRGFRVFPREYAPISGLPVRGGRTAPIWGVFCQTRRFGVIPQNLRRSWTYSFFLTPLAPKMHALGGVWTLSLKSALRLCAPHVRSADSSRRETAGNTRVCEQRPSRSRATGGQKTPIAWFEPAIYESDC